MNCYAGSAISAEEEIVRSYGINVSKIEYKYSATLPGATVVLYMERVRTI